MVRIKGQHHCRQGLQYSVGCTRYKQTRPGHHRRLKVFDITGRQKHTDFPTNPISPICAACSSHPYTETGPGNALENSGQRSLGLTRNLRVSSAPSTRRPTRTWSRPVPAGMPTERVSGPSPELLLRPQEIVLGGKDQPGLDPWAHGESSAARAAPDQPPQESAWRPQPTGPTPCRQASGSAGWRGGLWGRERATGPWGTHHRVFLSERWRR